MIDDPTTLPSLDEMVNNAVKAVVRERLSIWEQGDIIARALDHCTDVTLDHLGADRHGDWSAKVAKRVRRERSRVLGLFASAMHCTKAYVAQLVRVSGTFGNEQRWPERTWSWFRAVLNAAGRLVAEGEDVGLRARDLADEALRLELSVADLNQMGKIDATGAVLRAKYDCPECGCSTTVKAEGQAASRAETAICVIACPVCADTITRAGGDPRTAPRLGGLEAA